MTQPAPAMKITKGSDVTAEILRLVNERLAAEVEPGEPAPEPITVGDLPSITDAIFHGPGIGGKPVIVQTGAPWPAYDAMVVAFIFARDANSYSVYALPNRAPKDDKEILGPRRYVLRMDVFSFAAELLPTTWADEVAGEILNLLDTEDDDGDDEDDDASGDDADAGGAGSDAAAPAPASGPVGV